MTSGDTWEAAAREQERSEAAKMRSSSLNSSSQGFGRTSGRQNGPDFPRFSANDNASSSVFGGSNEEMPSSRGFGAWKTKDEDKSWRYQHDDRTEESTKSGFGFQSAADREPFLGGFRSGNATFQDQSSSSSARNGGGNQSQPSSATFGVAPVRRPGGFGRGLGILKPSVQKVEPQEPREDTLERDLDTDKGVEKAETSFLNKFLHDKLVQIQEDVGIANSSSPITSATTFEELHLKEELLKGIFQMGFSKPSKIQEKCLPVLIAEPPKNMIAQSQSGTGKTAAFVLTMLTRVDLKLNYPQCLCLAPTYELAKQIGGVVSKMGQFLPNLGIKYAVRGNRLSRGQQVQEQIIIGTPGTCLDWVVKFRFFDPKRLHVFVLDEADVMISQQGHQDQSIRIQQTLSSDCQLLLFSATYDDEVREFAEKIVPGATTFFITRREEQTLDNVKQYYIECADGVDKFRAISTIYGSLTIGQSIIFCQTRKTAAWLVQEMTQQGHAVALLSGELDITQRAAIIQRFKDAKEKVLITTNVCARGIDVQQVTIVINFDIPVTMDRQADFETYLHRIGRTGRFGKPGIAVNFLDDSEFSRKILQDIQNHFNKPIMKLDPLDVEALEQLDN